ncbi:MAG TPA: bifunctional GNAT family N-acetyltransferase/acetate--CoA ligase family protein [Blastocatellia bacterium]|nr:bifunctional GNAT family N-acetyltransferase/acetate--CoA ligase family protein [Blastocatellia bacterium]
MISYPAHYSSDIVLRDGSTLRLRPIKPDDAPGLMSLHNRLSPKSVYYRFFAPVPELTEERATELATVDYQNSFALVAEINNRIVAVARYYRNAEAHGRAEVSFVTEDALQGRGIATRMLERLAEIARDHEINTFEAYVLGDNRKMMDVFLTSGFEVDRRLEGGLFIVTFPIIPTPVSEEKAAARHQAAASASVRVFFEPKSIAVIGAGRGRGAIGAEIFHNLVAQGFQGVVSPVNKSAGVVGSSRAFPRLTDVPGDVDLAIVVVPAADVEAALDDCLAKGVRGIVVISAGFAEIGAAGRTREAAILEKVRAAGVRLVGPNCMGVINTDPAVSMNATFSPVYPPTGRVAMSTQSGALGLAILADARRLNIGISTFVSVGNKADVSSNDLIQYWADDPRTDVILLYLESFGNPRNFGRIARRISRHKPIVAVKSGRSRAGARAASSHTGALASTDAVVSALFRQAGIIRTDTLEELFDVANLLAHQPVPVGRRVGILTNAGGPGILAADSCEAHGLELPALADATVAELRSFLPATASVANPVDMIASATPEHYRRCTRALLTDPNIDSLIVIFIPPLLTAPETVAAEIVQGASEAGSKPVIANFMGVEGAPGILASIPSYTFPEAAAAALARVTSYGEWRRRPPGSVPTFDDIHAEAAKAIVGRAIARGGGWLSPVEVHELFGAAGIAMADSRFVANLDDAMIAAREIGFPVALKAVGPAIIHKTDVGGVALGLDSEAAVRAAYNDMAERLGSDLTGMLVQEMVEGGAEVVVGSVLDSTFGPLVLFGSGGVLVEMLNDVAFRMHPLTDVDVDDMLNEVKGTALMRGYRGAARLDEAALRELMMRVSALLEVCSEIHEMDANPVKVLEKGAVVVDARIRVARLVEAPPSRRIAY